MLRQLGGFFGRLGASEASGTGAFDGCRHPSPHRKLRSSSRVARPPLRKPPPALLASNVGHAGQPGEPQTQDRDQRETAAHSRFILPYGGPEPSARPGPGEPPRTASA